MISIKEGFSQFVSKPILRQAYQLKEGDTLTRVAENALSVVIGGSAVVFKHHEAVNAGDYVVYLNDSDTYHCNKAVFEERNEV